MSRSVELLLLGAGGHAAVVAESARAAGWSIAGCLDDDPESASSAAAIGLDRLGAIADLSGILSRHPAPLVVHAATGDAALRRAWLDLAADSVAPAIVHPDAIISPSADMTVGVFIGPAAVVNARARIGCGVIVNSGAIVEHDVILDPYCHVAPGSVVAGGAHVGESALVGAAATVLPGVRIGPGAILGAGSTAVQDIPGGCTAMGCPARVVPAATSVKAPP